ncbi:MAG: LptF/LptG family permease [Bacteroidales bacterium]|nr:LptF/LptG family permease [Bacteroidales bacterium]
MKKLNIYIIRQYIGTFIFTFVVAIFILLMNFLWTWVDELIGKGVEFSVMFKLLFFTSVTFVPMALPLAILLSSLMCFGNLGEYYELVAMKASGISTWKVMRPLLYFSLTMSVMGFFFSNNVMPVANLKMQSTLYDVTHKKMTLEVPEGVFYRGIDKYVIKIAKKSKDGNWMYDVMVYDHTDNKGNVKVTVADSGYMAMTHSQREMILTLYDGYNYTEMIDDKDYRTNRPFQKMAFKRQIVTFDMSQFDMKHMSEEAFKKHQTMLNIKQLNVAIDSLNLAYDNRMEHNNEALINRFQHLNADQELYERADKKLKKKKGDAIENDTIPIFLWPLLNNIPEKERQPIISMALNSTTNMKESLSITTNSMRRDRTNIKKHEQVLNQKFTLSVACILFFFIGAPLGAIIRKGGLGMPVVVSVVFFVIYYVITIIGERVAVNGDMSVFLGAWISSIVLFPVGIFLTFKATTDADLLDAEAWRKFFSKRKKDTTI